MSSRLGTYQLLECLGSAGALVAFKARHEESGAAALVHAFVPKSSSVSPKTTSLDAVACLYGAGSPEFAKGAAEMSDLGATPPWEVFAVGLVAGAAGTTCYVVTALPKHTAEVESWLRGLTDRVDSRGLVVPEDAPVVRPGDDRRASFTDMFGIATHPDLVVVPGANETFRPSVNEHPQSTKLGTDVEPRPTPAQGASAKPVGAFTRAFGHADEPTATPLEISADPVVGESSVTRFFATLAREGAPSKGTPVEKDLPAVKSVPAFGVGLDSAPDASVSEFTRQFGVSPPATQEPQSQRLAPVQPNSGTGIFSAAAGRSERPEPRTGVDSGRKPDSGGFTDFWQNRNKADLMTGSAAKGSISAGSSSEPVNSPDWDTHRFNSKEDAPAHVETFLVGSRHQDWAAPRSESGADALSHEPSLDNLLRATDVSVSAAPSASAGSHEATRLFQSSDKPTARQNPVASGPGGYTEVIQRDRLREQNDLAAPPPASSQAAPAQPHFPPMGLPPNPIGISSSGVSVSSPPTPQYPHLYPPTVPTLSPPSLTVPSVSGGSSGKGKTGYLPLILILNGLFVLAVLVVLYFLLKRH